MTALSFKDYVIINIESKKLNIESMISFNNERQGSFIQDLSEVLQLLDRKHMESFWREIQKNCENLLEMLKSSDESVINSTCSYLKEIVQLIQMIINSDKELYFLYFAVCFN